MIINEQLADFIGNLNRDYLGAVTDLTDAQLYFLPDDNCNHIAFHAWHFARTEDNIVNFVCQNRRPPVWIRQALHDKWGLPKVDQGTGMPHADANAMRLPGIEPFLQYVKDVAADTDTYLKNISEEELYANVFIRYMGDQPRLHVILQTIITHGNRHLGQIMMLRSLQGLQGESM